MTFLNAEKDQCVRLRLLGHSWAFIAFKLAKKHKVNIKNNQEVHKFINTVTQMTRRRIKRQTVNQQYEIKEILNHRKTDDKTEYEYYVSWYGNKKCDWILKKDFTTSQQLLKDYRDYLYE